MKVRCATVAFGLLSLVCHCAFAIQPTRDQQQDFISRAVFTGGTLWMLSDSGELSSITENASDRQTESLPEPAHDLCLHEAKPTIVTCARKGCASWTLRSLEADGWKVQAVRPARKEHVLGLLCEAEGVSLVTSERIVRFTGEPRRRPMKIKGKLPAGAVSSIHGTEDAVLVGINAGEWGGGLWSIDRKTGHVIGISSKTPNDPLGPVLDPEMDPVNAIASDPWKPGCVLVAIGLVHFLSHGRIVETCGRQVRRLYSNDYKFPADAGANDPDEKSLAQTVAFFSLAQRGETVWAAGIDGIHRVAKDGSTQRTSLPKFRNIGGIWINLDSPDYALVLTEINRRHSLGGAAPLLVPK